MARARNLKPSLFKNEILGVSDPLYTLLFESLWLLSDREGRLEDRPLRIKAETFPYREGLNIEEMLDWLFKNGFIIRYQFRGNRYIEIVNFVKHQNPHKNEPESTITSYSIACTDSDEIGTTSEKIGSARADSLNPQPDSLNPQPDNHDSSHGKNVGKKESKKDSFIQEWFDEFWQAYPVKQAKQTALKSWEKLRPDKPLFETILAAIAQQKTWPSWNSGYTPHPATWLNGRRWEDAPPTNQPTTNNGRKMPASENFATKDYQKGINEDGSF